MMGFLKWFLELPIRFFRWLVRLSKRSIGWLLMKVRSFVIKHPKVKAMVKSWLEKYPKLHGKIGRHIHRQNINVSQPESPVPVDATAQVFVQPVLVSQVLPEPDEPEQIELETKIVTASREWVTGRRLND